MDDLAKGDIDCGILWGPMAGYYASQANPPLVVVPLTKETTGPQMTYRIGMAVRAADQEWKRTLNRLIMENQAGDQQALDQLQHPDPRRDQHADHHRDAFEAAMIGTAVRCALIVIVATVAEAAAAEVPEPDGYRLENYRAPTPATLRGVKVIGTDEAETIWRSHSASFVDVLPRAPRPKNLPEGTAVARQTTVRYPRQHLAA